MRLSKIKLAGFKSFVDPTTIDLPSNLVGIVGPNGCGKSNTIDAVRWVMGESSAKHLRGDSMEDVIFNGSSSRKPVGQASIELVFDNSDGTLGGQYAEYSEISVKRQVSRDGQSNYYLNGSKCRRKDITDIFLGTGLGPRSYAIIEQGMISRLIEAKPEELRVYLEEAAGISKYKERRRETETRIRHTRENIDRLNDLRDEIEKQINHLQRQANTAERYKTLKEEERRARAELLVLRLRDMDGDAGDREKGLREEETRLEGVVAELRHLESTLEKNRERHVEANESFNEVQGRFYGLGSEISRVEQSIQHARELRERQTRELQQTEGGLREAREHIELDQGRLRELDGELESLAPQHQAGVQAREQANEALTGAEQAMSEWQGRWEDFNQRAMEPSQTAQVERTRMEHLERQIQHLQSRLERLQHERGQLSGDALRTEMEQLSGQAAEAQQAAEKLQASLTETLAAIQTSRESSRERTSQLDELRRHIQTQAGRLSSLEALQQAALGKGEKSVVQWLEGQGLAEAPRLAEQLQVESGWERAVEAVLGQYLEAVCVDDLDGVAQVLDSLTHGDLLVLDTGAGGEASAGDAPWLASRVTGPTPLNDLLRGVRTAATLPEALGLRSRLGAGESVITPEGIWLGRSWLRVLRDADEHAGVLGREQEIKSLHGELDGLNRQQEALQQDLESERDRGRELEARREELQAQVNRAHRGAADLNAQLSNRRTRLEQVEGRFARINEEIAEIEASHQRDADALQQATNKRNEAVSRMETLARERETLTGERDGLRERLDAARRESQTLRDALHQIDLRMQSLKSTRESTAQGLSRMEAQAGQFNERLEALQAAMQDGDAPIRALSAELETLLGKRVEVERALAEARTRVQSIEAQMREHDQRRIAVERQAEEIRSKLENLRMAWQEIQVRRQTLREQLGETAFSAEELLEALEEGATVSAWQEKVEQLAQRIQRLGPINLAAIDEFKEQSQRKDYLDAQYADLMEALETLENAIQKIDRETRQRFRDTFERVNARMQEMFPRLFGGGQAHLEMTGDDLLSTGVAVMARPPGKRLSTIHLMSGGEKALTAVALVFAIFELNPAPFCILDEVDAPLDEANVGRFCSLVKEMSEQVQFIFITHNKTTMELAEQLVGVTMREAGVSRLVAVDVEEAAQMAIA
ncbi:MAG: chromosome segregation protein SMC [Thioalkalivibrio sp.]